MRDSRNKASLYWLPTTGERRSTRHGYLFPRKPKDTPSLSKAQNRLGIDKADEIGKHALRRLFVTQPAAAPPEVAGLYPNYAQQRNLVVAAEFVDVETAKRSGRRQITTRLEHLKKNRSSCRTVLTEKTDRLYRNLRDWPALDDLGTTIHLVKEARVIAPDSRSSDRLMHGFAVLMARNYVLNLAEETRKGMLEKARTGVYPSYAPPGYLNYEGTNNRRTIIRGPNSAPTIQELYKRFETGEYSLESLVVGCRAEGVTLPGRKLTTSLVHQILCRRLYMGEFD